jgi:hypothetical protein
MAWQNSTPGMTLHLLGGLEIAGPIATMLRAWSMQMR